MAGWPQSDMIHILSPIESDNFNTCCQNTFRRNSHWSKHSTAQAATETKRLTDWLTLQIQRTVNCLCDIGQLQSLHHPSHRTAHSADSSHKQTHTSIIYNLYFLLPSLQNRVVHRTVYMEILGTVYMERLLILLSPFNTWGRYITTPLHILLLLIRISNEMLALIIVLPWPDSQAQSVCFQSKHLCRV